MFEWRSPLPNTVLVNAPPAIAGDEYGAPAAGFGPSLVDTGDITADVAYVGQGCDPAYQAGVPLDVYLDDPDGKIALIDRGVCTFTAKVKKAQDEGAVAVIVANNIAGQAPFGMGGSDPTITIVSVMVSFEDAATLKDNLDGLNVTLIDGTGGAPDRDSDLDAGVIIHEYGHGISNRLTGGPSNVSCLGNAEQMGEGWSDWLALALTAKPGDGGADSRGIGNYVVFEGPDGAGIRPTPYSTDMGINPTTYQTVIDETVPGGILTIPHGVGYAWATMAWEVYWNLVDEHGFNPNVYEDWTTGGNNLAIQLVIDGMKIQPCKPGFEQGRNAILDADMALTGGENQCLIWEGFAKRGLGFSAKQKSSKKTTDGVAGFDMPPFCGGTDLGVVLPIAGLPALGAAATLRRIWRRRQIPPA